MHVHYVMSMTQYNSELVLATWQSTRLHMYEARMQSVDAIVTPSQELEPRIQEASQLVKSRLEESDKGTCTVQCICTYVHTVVVYNVYGACCTFVSLQWLCLVVHTAVQRNPSKKDTPEFKQGHLCIKDTLLCPKNIHVHILNHFTRSPRCPQYRGSTVDFML